MKRITTILAASAAAFCLPTPAAAQESVPVPAFRSMELQGGGRVVLRHGPRQQVRLVRGDMRTSRIEVREGGKLVIEACRTSCRNYNLQVEIVTPTIDALAIRGGGTVTAQSGFAARPDLAAAITGGGVIDARSLAADNVSAAIRGGGVIRTTARANLSAAIMGGGAITYWGDPRVSQAVRGGGAVSRGR